MPCGCRRELRILRSAGTCVPFHTRAARVLQLRVDAVVGLARGGEAVDVADLRAQLVRLAGEAVEEEVVQQQPGIGAEEVAELIFSGAVADDRVRRRDVGREDDFLLRHEVELLRCADVEREAAALVGRRHEERLVVADVGEIDARQEIERTGVKTGVGEVGGDHSRLIEVTVAIAETFLRERACRGEHGEQRRNPKNPTPTSHIRLPIVLLDPPKSNTALPLQSRDACRRIS
jgi:hypothetical protein